MIAYTSKHKKQKSDIVLNRRRNIYKTFSLSQPDEMRCDETDGLKARRVDEDEKKIQSSRQRDRDKSEK